MFLNFAIERELFLLREFSPFALRQVAELKRPDGDAHEAQHLDAERIEHEPDLTVASFVEHDLEPAILLAVTEKADGLGAKEFWLDSVPAGLVNSRIANRFRGTAVPGFHISPLRGWSIVLTDSAEVLTLNSGDIFVAKIGYGHASG